MKLIIADDSHLFRERVKCLIKIFKSVEIVGEAENGIEALRLIDERKPDFVILDIRMPEMNGIETLRKLKERGSKAIICILTNYPYKQYRDKCFAEGADYFYSKSEDFEKINLAISETLSKMEIPEKQS